MESGSHPAESSEVLTRAGDVRASLILCGHTHIPRSERLADGRLIVNPGSVGLQAYEDQLTFPHKMETGTPHARYAFLEPKTRGRSNLFKCVTTGNEPRRWQQVAVARIGHERFEQGKFKYPTVLLPPDSDALLSIRWLSASNTRMSRREFACDCAAPPVIRRRKIQHTISSDSRVHNAL
jgi:calcineurin-like phosphoesterase family protein